MGHDPRNRPDLPVAAHIPAALLSAALALALAGCEPEDRSTEPPLPSGTLVVAWQIGLSSCADRGVATVEVTLLDTSGNVEREAEARCADRKIQMDGVPPGRYHLVVIGAKADGTAIYRGSRKDVEVMDGEVTRELVNLAVVGARVEVSWEFGSAAPYRFCDPNGVRTVWVTVFDPETARPVHDSEYPCNDGHAVLEDVRPGPLDISGLGIGGDGLPLFGGRASVEARSNEERRVSLVLEPCKDGDLCF